MLATVQTSSSEHSLSTAISNPKQLANQLNALKSTGPKSPEGKSRSAKNATKHGAYSLDTLLPNDNPEEYNRFKNEWLKVLSPQNPPELFLAERVASLAWRLQRFAKASTEKHQNHYTILSPSYKDENPYYTLAKTEDRLQTMFHRTLKQLQHLQTHQKENPPQPCPYVKEEKPQFEPTPQPVGCDSSHHSPATTEIPQFEPTKDQNPTPAPTTTALAPVVADENAQIERNPCAINPLSGANPAS